MREIRWRSPEFEYREKGAFWYLLTAAAAILLIAGALWIGNFLFAFFIVIAELMLIAWGRRIPAEINFKIDEHGLAIGEKKFYPYESFLGFTTRSEEIIFRLKNRFTSYLKILVSEADAGRIKSFLKGRLPEIEYEDSLIDHLSKILRF